MKLRHFIKLCTEDERTQLAKAVGRNLGTIRHIASKRKTSAETAHLIEVESQKMAANNSLLRPVNLRGAVSDPSEYDELKKSYI